MDYLNWELERQRAALWALLGGGEPEEDRRGEASSRKRETLPEEAERSAAGVKAARGDGPGEKVRRRWGREREAAGEAPGGGAPGAWEAVRAADWAASQEESGEPPVPVSAWEEFLDGAAASAWEGRSAETGAPARLRRAAPGEARGAVWTGKNPAAGPALPGGGEAGIEMPETALAAGAAEGWRTEEGFSAGGAAVLAPGGRRAAGDGSRAAFRDGSGGGLEERPGGGSGDGFKSGSGEDFKDGPGSGFRPASAAGRSGAALPGGPGTAGRAEGEKRLSRALPWKEGWESPALRAEAGARELSRAVQRDARRYDGGFAMY